MLASFFLLSTQDLAGQVNIKIGYLAGIGNFETNNSLLSMYAVEGEELTKPFEHVSFMHGIQLGLRYKVNNLALVFGWENQSRDRSALSFNAANDLFRERQYNYTLNSFSLGVDNYIGAFLIGASVQSRKLSIDREINGNSLGLIDQSEFSYRITAGFTLQRSELVSFEIRPFVQLPINDYNLENLATDLSATTTDGDYTESLRVIGISFVFYNGRQ